MQEMAAIGSNFGANQQGDPLAVNMGYMKVYDPIRNDPRFQTMLQKMHLLAK